MFCSFRALLLQENIAALIPEKPCISVVMPVHQASRGLSRPPPESVRNQIGVSGERLISGDGSDDELALVHRILADLGPETQAWKASVIFDEENRGVGI